jgi:hypothetical protein
MVNKITKAVFALFIVVPALFLTGCATFSGRTKSIVGVEAAQSNVDFEVLDAGGTVVANGTTPTIVRLDNGFLGKNKYTIRYKDTAGADAQKTIKTSIDGQVLGYNLPLGIMELLGPFWGFFVDPFSGALFKLPDVVTLQEE